MRKMKRKIGAAAMLALLGGLAAQASDPILFDLNTDRNGGRVDADYSDFEDLGITENIIGADVINVTLGSGSTLSYTNDVTGLSINSSGNMSMYSSSSTLNDVLKEYSYSGSTITIGGLDAYLTDGETNALYIAGVGDKAGQNSSITFNGETLTTSSSANPTSDDASNFVVRFEFVKEAGVDSISFDFSPKFNGFAIVSTAAPGPDVTTEITPEDGATYVTNLPTIEVVVTEGELEVDTTSFAMSLIAGGVTSDVTAELLIDGTTFSYTPDTADRLDNGTEYTVLYTAGVIGGDPVDYTSAFTTAPDLHNATTPADGAQYVATNGEVSVTFTNVAVNLSNLYVGHELILNSSDVSGDVAISYPTNGVMKFDYTGALETGMDYDVELNVFRSDDYTNTVEFAFSSALDPSVYLIGPGIRNGGFELVNGEVDETTHQVSIGSGVDDWSAGSGTVSWTELIDDPSEGVRALVTATGSETYNMTETLISDGDIFEFAWNIPGRANGVYVGLAYDDGGSMVILSNSLVYTSGTTGEISGSYLVDSANDPDAIGNPVGLIIIDDGDSSNGGAVYVDEVRLYYGNIAVQSVSPADGAAGVDALEPIEVVIAEAASQVDTNSIVLTLDGEDITADAIIVDTASGVTVTYTPTNELVVGTHFVEVSADGTPEGAASQSWSFLVDPNGTYLISPDLRNGSFELVDGAQGSGTVSDWSTIDYWTETGTGTVAKTEDNTSIATDGSRIMVTATGSENYNMTDTVIANGDRFGYSIVVAGRSYGLNVALCYLDGSDVVVISNSMTEVFGGTTPFPISTEYTFSSNTDPDAIGKTVGIILIDDGDLSNNGYVQIDEVRLYTDESQPTEEPEFTAFSIDGTTVTLSWTTEDLGLYSLQSKPSMSSFEDWVTVYSNLPSGATTTNVPMSGDDQEFYRVISE